MLHRLDSGYSIQLKQVFKLYISIRIEIRARRYAADDPALDIYADTFRVGAILFARPFALQEHEDQKEQLAQNR